MFSCCSNSCCCFFLLLLLLLPLFFETRDNICRKVEYTNVTDRQTDGHWPHNAPNRWGRYAMLLSDVRRLLHTSGLRREQRGLGRLKLAHHFAGQKVKGQGHHVALLSAALTRKAAAVVSVGTYWPW